MYLRFLFFGLLKYGIDHKEVTEKANYGSHFDAAGTEDVGIEALLRRAATGHQDKAQDDNGHTHGKQDEVGAGECKLSLLLPLLSR